MKKKLIFISEALWIGGIETALVNLVNRLDYDKYDVTCLIIRDYQEMAKRITPKCKLLVADRQHSISFKEEYKYKKIYNLMEEPQNASKLRRMLWKLSCILFKALEMRLYSEYIKKQMDGKKFDTAVIYSDRTAEITVRAVKAKQYLMFYHNAVMEKAYHDEIGYRKCEKIIAVSEKKAEELKVFRPKYIEKYMTIHNLVDIQDIVEKSKEKTEVVFAENNFNLVTCGRLAYQKAIDWAIIACKKLVEKGYKELQWWIVGGGPDEAVLQKQIIDAGIEKNFHLLGMQNNPYPYIANADLYIQPSRYENYSVVILEAMALCKPILATIPAAEMQIKSGENGLLCDADPNKIAESIEYLYLHKEEREKYIQALENDGLEKANEEIMKKLYHLFEMC